MERRLALFGAYRRGETLQGSDVDVLVDVDPSIGICSWISAERTETVLGVRAPVVSRRAISARQWAEIETEVIDVA